MRKIGILTSGGDAPGMNACIYEAYRLAKKNQLELVGFIDGYLGIMYKNYIILDKNNTKGIKNLGGTILYSRRYQDFEKKVNQKKAAMILKDMGVTDLICIGGDGTSKGAISLTEYGINTYVIPATIDNDVKFSDYALGFDTCCKNASNSIQIIKDTMRSHHRIGVYETMGRYCGDICNEVSKMVNADVVIPFNKNKSPLDYLDEIKKKSEQLDSLTVVISEHQIDLTEFCKSIESYCKKETRGVVLGYIQRGGNSKLELNYAKELTNKAFELILNNNKSSLIGYKKGNIVIKEIE